MKPCKRGHIAGKNSVGGCVECAKLTQRLWAAANPDRVRAKSRESYERNKAKKIEAARQRRLANAERLREYDRVRYESDPLRYRESRLAAGKRWEENHPDRVLAKTRRRAAARIKRLPSWADQDAIRIVYRAADIAKVTWPEVQIHVDHDVPLRGRNVSGLHVHNNLRIVLAEENMRKGNRFC